MSRRPAKHPPAGERPRRALGTAVLVVALLLAATGLVVVGLGPWRLGAGIVGSGLLLGSFARTLMPERRAGLLRVRGATADVIVMTALGVAIVLLALLVPDQPRR